MVEIISGQKGKGKTKVLINRVNIDIKLTNGSIVYLDKNNKHMYELSNRIRLINVPSYNITNFQMFLGFIYGIISGDHDLDKIYLDSFLTIGFIDKENISDAINALIQISDQYEVDFVLSVSMDKSDFPSDLVELISTAL